MCAKKDCGRHVGNLRFTARRLFALAALFALLCSGCGNGAADTAKDKAATSEEPSGRIVEDVNNQGVGDVEIATLQVPKNMYIKRAAYSASGSVILAYQMADESKNLVSGIGMMNDDGTGFHSIYQGEGVGQRLLVYADNTRILMGSTVLECPEGTTLDNCPENAAEVYGIVFPEEYLEDERVFDIWSEVIISPDNQHMAWTMLRTDCGASVAIGELNKATVDGKTVYKVENSQLISRMTTYVEDPEQEGCLVHRPVIGGEVKQFVHGGSAIALVGAGSNGMPQSVTWDLATGEYTIVTQTPGYDETTMFSPDEKLGVTMTSRFSETSNVDVLGLVPRPYGDAVMEMANTLYLYSVTGVRKERKGNVGPALINIEQSMKDEDYVGLDLSDPDDNWVFASPISWKADGSKVMWMEKQREGGGRRVQIATLKDYQPGEAVSLADTYKIGDYSDKNAAVEDVDGKINGAVSGYVEISKQSLENNESDVRITYHNYSDDGTYFYDGSERARGGIGSGMTYEADLQVTNAEGKQEGSMDVKLIFSGAYANGKTSPQLDKENSHGTAIWKDKQADIEKLVE